MRDRIDLRVYVRAVEYKKLRGGEPARDTASMREYVERARAAQSVRQGVRLNAHLPPRGLEAHCRIDDQASAQIETACNAGKLTARGVARILRVARTVADIAGEAAISENHVTLALGWRLPPRG